MFAQRGTDMVRAQVRPILVIPLYSISYSIGIIYLNCSYGEVAQRLLSGPALSLPASGTNRHGADSFEATVPGDHHDTGMSSVYHGICFFSCSL